MSFTTTSNNNNNNRTNMQLLPPPHDVLTTILTIILMTLTTMTIIPIILNNNDVVVTVFTRVAAEGGNLNAPYLPYAYPVDCCAYELSGTTEDSFPALLVLLTDPSDKSERGITYFYPPGSHRVVPRKLNNDTNNTNSNTDINDSNSSDAVSKCSGSNFSLWYGYFDINYPVKGWTMNEWNTPPVKGEPIHVENNGIWAKSTTSTIYHQELIGRLIKVDLECTPPLLSVPPQQRCVLLWSDPIHPWWRHKYGGDQCIGATTTIVPPRPSNNTDRRAYMSSISFMMIIMMMMTISLQLMWHIIL